MTGAKIGCFTKFPFDWQTVQRTARSRGRGRRSIARIDLNVPYDGTSDSNPRDHRGCRHVWPEQFETVFQEVTARRCATCQTPEDAKQAEIPLPAHLPNAYDRWEPGERGFRTRMGRPTGMIRRLGRVSGLWLLVSLAACRGMGPGPGPPGTVQQQQLRASVHDPYADPKAGPEVVGGRPRDYQNPLPEATRNRFFGQRW